jgi:choline dehydrogenase-like flavoprotein
VEKFIGVCGTRDGIEAMPDGEFLPPFDFNCAEAEFHKKVSSHYPDRYMVHARWAHLTEPKEIHIQQGRSRCQARNRCMRGCPFGGYFSSVSSTLPWAKKTGNLFVRPFSVVHSIIYDDKKGKATGVRIIDTNTKETFDYYARIIFLNASALNSNLVLLNSTSSRFPNGLGNDSGMLGKFVAFHNYRASVFGKMDGMEDKYIYGRNPTEPIIANYRNLKKHEMDYVGGFTTFMGAYRSRNSGEYLNERIGAEFKEAITQPGSWGVYMYMQGETVMKESNHVRLSADKKDQWGIPLLITSVDYDDNDEKMIRDFLTQGAEMLEIGGCKEIGQNDTHQPPGLDIHEMGGCKMGSDSKRSVLNEFNQLHHCKNVFVTDGAAMSSTGNQSPSLLYMALTARAATHAVSELKKGNL